MLTQQFLCLPGVEKGPQVTDVRVLVVDLEPRPRPGIDLMKPFRPNNLRMKPYLVELKFVLITLYGSKKPQNPRLLSIRVARWHIPDQKSLFW
jgi:hypothetical protein